MTDEKMESVPVGKRTRCQRALREKALCEENKRARAAAPSENRKNNRVEEDVIVVDESEYLKRTSTLRGGGSSGNGNVGPESDDSVKILGEKWNLSGAGFDLDDDDDEDDNVDVDADVASEGSGGASDGSYSSFEDDDESSDEDFKVDVAEMRAAFSSEGFSSDDSGINFKQKEKQKTGKTFPVVNRNDGCRRKKNDRFLNEDKHSGIGDILCVQRRSSQDVWPQKKRNVGIQSEPKHSGFGDILCVQRRSCQDVWPQKKRNVGIQSEPKQNPLTENSGDSESDSIIHLSKLHSCSDNADKPVSRNENCLRKTDEGFVEEPYVQWLSSSNKGHNSNLGKFTREKKRRVSKYRKARIEFEPRKGYMCEDSESDEDGSFVHSSLPVYPKNDRLKKFESSEDDGNKKRGKLSKGKKVVSESKSKNFDNYEACTACSFVHPSSVLHFPRHQSCGYPKRGRASKNWSPRNYRVESESENFEGSDNGGERKIARPRKSWKVTMKSTIQWINKLRK